MATSPYPCDVAMGNALLLKRWKPGKL